VVTDDEVVDAYIHAAELGDRYGCLPCFEVHVNMWSEDFPRVARVGRLVEARGVEFNMTLDHSHVVFKIDNPDEQQIFDTSKKIAAGDLILDPFTKGNVIAEWIEAGWIRHCHARAAIPNNPKNINGRHPDGSVGRGNEANPAPRDGVSGLTSICAPRAAGNVPREIQYPFKKPSEGAYHALWHEDFLEPWKEGIRLLVRHHVNDPKGKLGQISTEFIPNTDYGEGCGYSLFEQAIACVEWMRETWAATIVQADANSSDAT